MDFYDIIPIILNPILVKRLNGNIESAILVMYLNRRIENNLNNNDWIELKRNEISRATGLTENKILVSERYLKKINILTTKIFNRIHYYKINSLKLQKMMGYNLTPLIIKKLNHNAKAAILLEMFLEFNQTNDCELYSEIPSLEVELSTGMTKNSQIYARDSLIGMNILLKVNNKSFYKLNIEELINRGLIRKKE